MSDHPESGGDSKSPASSFDPVPTRRRRDGWTAERQRRFIEALRCTRRVGKACAAAGMSRVSAYKLRARPGARSFAAAWDAAIGPPPPAAPSPNLLWSRAFRGVARPFLLGSGEVTVVVTPDDAALMRLLGRFNRRGARRRGSSR